MAGVGLYKVGLGQTYATIQAAHDALVVDQGVAPFTAEQEIRIYAGTYTEYVTIDHTLEPQPRYHLVFKAAAGDSPVWSCQGLIGVMYTASTLAYVDFDGLTFSGTSTGGSPIQLSYNSTNFEFRNCTFTLKPTGTSVVKYSYQHMLFIDCELDGDDKSFSFFHGFGNNHGQFVRCNIHGYNTVVNPPNGGGVHMESCTVHDVNDVVYAIGGGHVTLLNNTFYDIAGSVLHDPSGRAWLIMLDNIFDKVIAVIKEVADADDAFTSSHVVIDDNCYNSVTKWYDSVGEADVTTFAAWQALGYDANGLSTDPLLTNPAAGDFNLQSASPCRGSGQGSGITKYYDGTPADSHHPNIGATGLATDPPTPIWGGGASNIIATDAVQNDRVEIEFDASSIGGVGLTVEYCVQYRIGASTWTHGWIGEDLSVSIADLIQDQEYEFRVGARCSDYEQDWVYPSDTDTATPTGISEPIAPVISGVVDDKTSTSATLSLVADNPMDVLTVRYRALDVHAWTVFGETRVGSGDLQVTGLNPSKWTFIATSKRGGDNSLPSNPMSVWVTTGSPEMGDMRSMPLLRRPPHTVVLKRPTISRDADNNVATRDYDNPVYTASVRCLFQSRGGEVSIGDEGNIIPFDAKMYTLDKNIEVNDRIEVSLSFYTGNFLVTAVVPKGRIRGGYSHNEVFLQKDGVR